LSTNATLLVVDDRIGDDDRLAPEVAPEALRREREKVSWLGGGRGGDADDAAGYSVLQEGYR